MCILDKVMHISWAQRNIHAQYVCTLYTLYIDNCIYATVDRSTHSSFIYRCCRGYLGGEVCGGSVACVQD
jgi:hypothetical protein